MSGHDATEMLQLPLASTTKLPADGSFGFHDVTLLVYLAPLIAILVAILVSVTVLYLCVLCTCTSKPIINHDFKSRQSDYLLSLANVNGSDCHLLMGKETAEEDMSADDVNNLLPIITVNSAPNLLPKIDKEEELVNLSDTESAKSDNWAAIQIYKQRNNRKVEPVISVDGVLYSYLTSTSSVNSLTHYSTSQNSTSDVSLKVGSNNRRSRRLKMSRSFNGNGLDVSRLKNELRGSHSYQTLPHGIPKITVRPSSQDSSVSLSDAVIASGSEISELWRTATCSDNDSDIVIVDMGSSMTSEMRSELLQKLSVV